MLLALLWNNLVMVSHCLKKCSHIYTYGAERNGKRAVSHFSLTNFMGLIFFDKREAISRIDLPERGKQGPLSLIIPEIIRKYM